MIGNLINAVALCMMSSLFVVGSVRADEVRDQTENVIAYVDSYVSTDTKVYTPLTLPFENQIIFENTFGYQDVNRLQYYGLNNTYGELDTQFGGDFDEMHSFGNDYLVSTGATLTPSGLPTNYTLKSSFYFSTSGEVLTQQNKGYVIDGLEMWFMIKFYDDDNAYLGTPSSMPTFYINNQQFTLGSYNDDFGLCSINFTGLTASNYVYRDFPVITVALTKAQMGSATNVHIDCVGQWCCNYQSSSAYQNGFSSGVSSGYTNGYNNGYADALALYQNGDFNNLFNSIADTPLRFIYGLFSFDLFGTSMLVIVLTLITGIFVFGLVKKIWK